MLEIYAKDSDENRPKQLDRWKKADEAKKKEHIEKYKKSWKDGEPKRAAGMFPHYSLVVTPIPSQSDS